MLWLYLHFPHLLLDHVRRASQTPGATVIVSGSPAQVRQACPIAQQLGIHPDMRLKTALSLAPEELAVIQPEPNQEQVILEQQASWLYRYAAQVVPHSPDGLLLEAGSLLRLYGSLDSLWHTLEQAVHTRRLTARFATGATPKAARLLAQTSQGVRSQDTTLLTQAIGQLPLAAAELDVKTLERLTRLGLTTLNEVFRLPPKELARRLAPDTLAYVQRIQGTRPDPQHFWQPSHRFHQQVDFVREVEHAQGLLFPLQPMLNELEEDLQWRQADTDRLTLSLTHRDGTTQRLSISRSGPDHRASTFLELTRLRLESCPLASPVTAMALTVTRFIPRRTPSAADLFGETADSREAWQALISRLQARLGEPALQRLTLNADHRPECAWSAAQVHRSETGGALPALAGQFTRPLWLLAAPHPLQQTPEQWLSGPERICSGWWDDNQVQRDYYAVQLPGGQVAWIFRDARGDWFIHGWFG
ncbi:Y-family DNA polymerase [Marinobacter zhejiangensis]|uniref:Protein ImuB n=1 Tax=Marinobacter zhejiangensis TaxID=488535 RepID=A0A1I4RDQ9_9GAMM|nr:DNA polymerase Y family protein [Marinobacter zhejiangensis]SFM50418.1 protein ImuB [Marinobacter zhejiangensis]